MPYTGRTKCLSSISCRSQSGQPAAGSPAGRTSTKPVTQRSSQRQARRLAATRPVPASVRAALDGVNAVVHLAAILNPNNAPDLARRVNVDATRSLIAEMETSATARRLVFASSQGIFGDVQDREPPLRVDSPVSPIAPLIRLLRPVITWFVVRSSPYLRENRRVGSS
jgi:nucleoside-diphosphate-sugar epimerase